MIELYPGEKLDFFCKEDDPYRQYLISNFGRVYSLKSNKFLKPFINNCGYLRADIRYFKKNRKTNKYRKMVFIHIEVVKVFGDCIGNKISEQKKYIDVINIDHINKNKYDCRQSNLQIVSALENQRRKNLSDDELMKIKKQLLKDEDVDINSIF